MYVQWCAKGLNGITDDEARSVMLGSQGLICRWWRNVDPLPSNLIASKLTLRNLDWHVNRYSDYDPGTGQPFCEGSPFISLSAGTVEREVFLKSNIAHTAWQTALGFATDWGAVEGYVYICYVIVALNSAVAVESVSEEVRELKTYRRYSAYNPEGEIAAKIRVPANQIRLCMKLAADLTVSWTQVNPGFVAPTPILNQRMFI